MHHSFQIPPFSQFTLQHENSVFKFSRLGSASSKRSVLREKDFKCM